MLRKSPSQLLLMCIGGATVVGCAAGGGHARGEARPAPASPTETHFGITYQDPYSWMELGSGPRLDEWIATESQRARATLDRLPERVSLEHRIEALEKAVDDISDMQSIRGRTFYLRRPRGSEAIALMTRDAHDGSERVVVAPDPASAIDWFSASPDGRYVVYQASQGGSERGATRILEVETQASTSDEIFSNPRGEIHWLPAEAAFLYARPKTRPDIEHPASKGERVYYHRVGTRIEADVEVLGEGGGGVVLHDDDRPQVEVRHDSAFAVATVRRGVDKSRDVYIKPKEKLLSPSVPWQQVAAKRDDVVGVAFTASHLFLLSQGGAPRRQILRVSVQDGKIGERTVFAAESGAIRTALTVAGGDLYVSEMEAGVGRVEWMQIDSATPHVTPLPFVAAVRETVVSPTEDGVFMQLEGWNSPARWFHVRRDAVVDLQWTEKIALAEPDVERAMVRSEDGTLVPLTILRPRDVKRDGTARALLVAYGAYGLPLLPGFSTTFASWLSMGNVLAIAHVRGGGELGEAWHVAGQKFQKQRGVEDFIASAKYLVEQKYSRADRLTARGVSAGGLVVASAMEQSPESFGAVVLVNPLTNTTRLEGLPGGSLHFVEFGDPHEEAGFRSLFSMDPYHHLRPGVAYPPVIVSIGEHDSRIPPWMSAKFVARLQDCSSSGAPVLLRVGRNEGHAGGGLAQDVQLAADTLAFALWQTDGAKHGH